jgi:hypothetical protein
MVKSHLKPRQFTLNWSHTLVESWFYRLPTRHVDLRPQEDFWQS